MILVVCPNLAVDITLEVETLHRGAVHRAPPARRQAGGKGVNVARALEALGERAIVLGFAGGSTGETIAEGLEAEGVEADLIAFAGESRTCTILLEPDGTATVVNEAGPRIDDQTSLLSRFEAKLDRGKIRAVALMGSLPRGLPPGSYAEMVKLARKRGALSLVDTSGEPLRRALAAGPDFAKPNRAEAQTLLGVELGSESSRLDALASIREMGASTALLTLGPEGFLLASDDGLLARCTPAAPSDLRLGNPTGAGDSLAAGLLAGKVRGYPLPECARLAAAAATASLAEGYGRFRVKDLRVENVRFELLTN